MALQVRKRQLRRRSIAQRQIARQRRSRILKQLSIAIGVLLFVAVAAGIAYTWYNGQKPPASAIAKPAEKKVAPKFARPTPRKDAKVGVSIQSLTSPVAPGDNASIIIRTNPEATCVIEVKYGETKSLDTGLVKKTADEFGIVNWAWTVETGTQTGKWPVTVTCKNQKNSGVVVGDLTVALPTD